ncbi:MAG: tetratricopeptide repeat protein [Coriobacteriia bacterium]|nr:tetratricopeptide repeat protein [Coriobacteriia bacterium]
MDHNRFQEAQQAYDAGDYRIAAKTFLASAGRGADGNGAAYHMAGNALLRLRRYQDAVTVYAHALRDEIYDRRGAVHANLGAAHFALADYAEAVAAYGNALKEADYSTPYKALQGMASALLERGRIDEAAAAYRKAALDPGNSDPGKALVNLGLCFMALGRPADAVEAYQAALGFDEYKGRGKALANLGQAHVALGEYEEAIKAFEKATQLHAHGLSASAGAAYEAALAHLRASATEKADSDGQQLNEDSEEWGCEEGADSSAEQVVLSGDGAVASWLDFGDDRAVAEFFSATDEQLRERDRAARREARAQGVSGGSRGVRMTVLIVALVVCAAAVAAWLAGYGWPTQQQTVSGMLSAYSAGTSITSYWVAVPEKDVAKEMAKLPVSKTYSVDGVVRGRQNSSTTITVTPQSGAALRFTVTLAREGLGWKVTGIDNDWLSTGSGS